MSTPSSVSAESLSFSQRLNEAEATYDGSELVVPTGKIRRVWRVIGTGLATASLKLGGDALEWIQSETDESLACDWRIFRLVEKDTRAVLTSARAVVMPREGSIGERLQVEVCSRRKSFRR
jgi:hypothetical protein